MILPAGTFKVSDYRKAIPDWVKVQVVINHVSSKKPLPSDNAKMLRFDHRPSLNSRDYDTDKADFIPPQNAPGYIELVLDQDHDKRTFGREPGAERTVTTRGSDVGEASRVRKISVSHQASQARLEIKSGRKPPSELMIAVAAEMKKDRKKKKIRSQGFSDKSRPFPTRRPQ